MDKLIEITDWKASVSTRGRYATEKRKKHTRYIVCFDRWCWSLAKETDYGKIFGQKFFKGFCHLMKWVTCYGADLHETARTIIEELSKRTDKPTLLYQNGSPEHIGNQIDDYYQVNFNMVSHEPVYEKLTEELYNDETKRTLVSKGS